MWWAVNGESIRGTTRTPLAPQAWGQTTRKGNRLYLHVFQWPTDGKLVVGGLKTEIESAWLLADPQSKLKFERSGLDQIITVPPSAPDATNSVVVLECASDPLADPVRVLSQNVPVDTLHVFDGKLVGGLRYGPGKKTDDVVLNWKSSSDAVVWPVRVNEETTYEVSINYITPEVRKTAKIVEGDAGKETSQAGGGAEGAFIVKLGSHALHSEVRQGKDIEYVLGEATLKPGEQEIRVEGVKITGEELMRLRKVMLKPLRSTTRPSAQ
jgi:alpha-L-fucosidase